MNHFFTGRNTLIILVSILLVCCANPTSESNVADQTEKLQAEIDDLKKILEERTTTNHSEISTFLTFQDGNAENAMNFYVALFDNSKIVDVQRWGKDGPVAEGKIMHATFKLNGSSFMCSDSPPSHTWDFSPAVSNFIECKSDSELERLFSKLSENGEVTMPLNNYGFSQKFGWVIDQWGVSWQLNLP